jgi:hypothetical protein
MPVDDAGLGDFLDRHQVGAVVHTRGARDVLRRVGRDAVEQREHGGEEALAVRGRLDLLQRVEQRRALEDIRAQVDLADLEILG